MRWPWPTGRPDAVPDCAVASAPRNLPQRGQLGDDAALRRGVRSQAPVIHNLAPVPVHG